jgi:hypothetical protein
LDPDRDERRIELRQRQYARNRVHGNTSAGIFFEISDDAVVAGPLPGRSRGPVPRAR